MNLVEQELLTACQLGQDDLTATLAHICQRDIDFADLYFQASSHESWMLEDGIVKEGSYNIEVQIYFAGSDLLYRYVWYEFDYEPVLYKIKFELAEND